MHADEKAIVSLADTIADMKQSERPLEALAANLVEQRINTPEAPISAAQESEYLQQLHALLASIKEDSGITYFEYLEEAKGLHGEIGFYVLMDQLAQSTDGKVVIEPANAHFDATGTDFFVTVDGWRFDVDVTTSLDKEIVVNKLGDSTKAVAFLPLETARFTPRPPTGFVTFMNSLVNEESATQSIAKANDVLIAMAKYNLDLLSFFNEHDVDEYYTNQSKIFWQKILDCLEA